MLIKLILKIFFLFTLIESVSNAEVSSKFFDKDFVTIDNGSVSDTNQSLSQDRIVEEDLLEKGAITTDNTHYKNLRKDETIVSIDEHGNTLYLNSDGSENNMTDYTEPADFNASKEKYLELYKNISSSTHTNKVSLLSENREIYLLKQKNLEMAKEVGLSPDQMKNFSAGSLSKAEYSVSTFNEDINNLEAKQNNGEELSSTEIDELNATKFYKENYGIIPKNSDGTGLKRTLEQENKTALSRAYQEIDSLVDFYKSEIGNPLVKCQLSRELVPSFHCPISGMSALRFPTNTSASDMKKVDSAVAKKECEDYCVTPPGFYPTIEEKMIQDINANTNFGGEKELFPNFDNTLSSVVFSGNEIVPLKDIRFKINFPKPEINPNTQEEMTDEEWQKIIDEHKPVVKFSFWFEDFKSFQDENGTIPLYSYNSVYMQKPLMVHSALQTFSFPIYQVARNYKIIFYKPYFQYQSSDGKMRTYNSKITISDLEGEYTSTSFHYCSIYQMVSLPSDCKDRNKVKEINLSGVTSSDISSLPGNLSTPGQKLYLCADSERKIGPEPVWGAFYTRESAENACVSKSQCIPSYNNTTFFPNSDPTVFYKPVIDCVDDPTNLNCSKQLCEALFPSTTDTIVNEYQPYTEITSLGESNVKNVYSIQNRLRTESPRPKINFGVELMASPDFEEAFNDEEKDQAYLYMLENLRYNRSKYRIGEESPVSIGYDLLGNNNGVVALIKPYSYDFGSPNNLKLYSIMRIESNFKPSAGMWVTGETSIGSEQDRDPESTDPYVKRIKDVTYLIKTGEGTNDWSIFRRIRNHSFYIETITFVWNETTLGLEEKKVARWSQIPAYQIDEFETYNGSWAIIDSNSIAPNFSETKFNINQNKFLFTLTDNYKAVSQIPGVLFGNQIIVDNGLKLERDYTIPADLDLSESSLYGFDATGYEENWDKMSYSDNIDYYIYYNKDSKSYLDLIEEIEGTNWEVDRLSVVDSTWGVYSNKKPEHFLRGDINYDGEINNHIKFIVKGRPESLTFGVDWDPRRTEKGHKVYKFSFLFDDPEYEPFDIIGGN